MYLVSGEQLFRFNDVDYIVRYVQKVLSTRIKPVND